MASAEKSTTASELVAYRGKDSHLLSSLQLLSKKRGCTLYTETHGTQTDETMITWSMHRKRLQVDCTILEPLFLGKRQLTVEDTARVWDEILAARDKVLDRYSQLEQVEKASDSAQNTENVEDATADCTSLPDKNRKETFIGVNLGDGGRLQSELNTALAAVQKASFMSRSLQRYLLNGGENNDNSGTGSINKGDKSPVTIADFAVQALVIYCLSQAFPQDKFIAEEDSELLRSDVAIREGVLTALKSAAPTVPWTEEMLYSTIDKGMFEGSAPRVWVLDPVDGNTRTHPIISHLIITRHIITNRIITNPIISHLIDPRLQLSINLPIPSIYDLHLCHPIDLLIPPHSTIILLCQQRHQRVYAWRALLHCVGPFDRREVHPGHIGMSQFAFEKCA